MIWGVFPGARSLVHHRSRRIALRLYNWPPWQRGRTSGQTWAFGNRVPGWNSGLRECIPRRRCRVLGQWVNFELIIRGFAQVRINFFAVHLKWIPLSSIFPGLVSDTLRMRWCAFCARSDAVVGEERSGGSDDCLPGLLVVSRLLFTRQPEHLVTFIRTAAIIHDKAEQKVGHDDVTLIYWRHKPTYKPSAYDNASFTLAHFYCAFSAPQKICQCKWTVFDAFSASRRMCRNADMSVFPLGICVSVNARHRKMCGKNVPV